MGDSLWLLRLPETLAAELAGIGDGASCGRLESSQGGLKLHTRDGESFAVEELRGGPQLLAFGVDETRRYSFAGSVTRSLALRPTDLGRYSALLRARSEAAAQRPSAKHTRKTEVVESSIIDFVPPKPVQLRLQADEMKQAAKRSRLSGDLSTISEPTADDLRNKIFEAFQKDGSGRLQLKALTAFVRNDFPQVADKDLKEELEKYALYNRKGPTKGTWELKSDFKQA